MKKVVAATLLTIAVSGLQASFSWKEAIDGDWTVAENWLNGVPSFEAGECVFLVNQAGPYAVGLSNTTDQVIGGLQIKGSGNYENRASLVIENSKLKVQDGNLFVTNGEIRIREGGVLEVDNGFASLNYGGRIIVDGGVFAATNKFKYLVADSQSVYNGADHPLLEILSGEAFIKYSTNVKAGISLQVFNYASLKMSGGTLTLDSDGTSETLLNLTKNNDTEQTMELSGNSVLKIINGGATFGRGISTLKDNASIIFVGNDRNHCQLQPYSSDSGRRVTYNLQGNSSFNVTSAKFYFGKPMAHSTKTVGNLNISGGNHSFGRRSELGCGHGMFTTTITGGHTEFKQYGLRIGAYPDNPSNTDHNDAKPFACTSTVNIANGVLYLRSNECHNDSARKSFWGTVVGFGRSGVHSGWFDGRLNISGDAIVTNGVAPLFVGVGNSIGCITQTGGELHSIQDGNRFSNWDRSALVLGLCGGNGSYIMTGGIAEYTNSVFVGGVSLDTINRPDAQTNMPANDGSSVGLLDITGGSFSAGKTMTVGALGTGVVHVANNATLTIARSLVLSNSVENAATLTLTLSGDAPPTVKIGESLFVKDGAKLVVDVTDFDTRSVWTKLVSCSSRNGSFSRDDILVIGGENVRGTVVQDRSTDPTGSIWWYRPKGTTFVIR